MLTKAELAEALDEVEAIVTDEDLSPSEKVEVIGELLDDLADDREGE